MFAKRKARLFVFTAFAAMVGGGLFIYVTPASTKVDPAPVYHRPGIIYSAMFRTWGEDLSADAVDAAGIETDLDGNALALLASDYVG
jgi:hypothetical protein